MNTRRKLIIALGASSLAAPFTSLAQQQGKVWRIGFLSQRRITFSNTDYFGAFPQGLRELGYVEGKNLVIELRSADNRSDRLPELAAELVRLKVDVIVTSASSSTKAALNATSTIPIVMVNVTDPVGNGFVAGLGRPGGNVTGLSTLLEEVSAKHLEMLHGIVPKVSLMALLGNPITPSLIAIQKNVLYRANKVGVKVLLLEARDVSGIQEAFPKMARDKAGALVVVSDGLLNQHRQQVAELAVKHRLPSIAVNKEYAEAGGLMSYGPSYADNFRRAATYVDKIFKGTKPADLPVEQPTKFELVVNMKTAKTLGIKIPNSILVQATKVIE